MDQLGGGRYKGTTNLASELDLGVVVPDEDAVEERVLAERGDNNDDVLRPLPMQNDGRYVPFLLVQEPLVCPQLAPPVPSLARRRRRHQLLRRKVRKDLEGISSANLDFARVARRGEQDDLAQAEQQKEEDDAIRDPANPQRLPLPIYACVPRSRSRHILVPMSMLLLLDHPEHGQRPRRELDRTPDRKSVV